MKEEYVSSGRAKIARENGSHNLVQPKASNHAQRAIIRQFFLINIFLFLQKLQN